MHREPISRPRRIDIRREPSTQVTLRRFGQAKETEIHAEMLDVSRRGTKLCLSAPLRFDEAIELHVEISTVGLDCHVLATVRHIREAGEGRWIVGCAVTPPLDEHAISRLAAQLALNRRRWKREPISLAATVQRQLGGDDLGAVVQNISPGGFCVRLTRGCEPDERIRLTVRDQTGNSAVIEARVRWQACTAEGFFVGCNFLGPDGYDTLQAASTPEESLADSPKTTLLNARTGMQVVCWGAFAFAACILAWPFVQVYLQGQAVASNTERRPTGGHTEMVSHAVSDDVGPAKDSRVQPIPELSTPREDVHKDRDEITEMPIQRESELREWTDDTGIYRVMATILEVKDEHVRLRRENGKEIEVPMSRLSTDDVEFALQFGAAVSSTSE